MNAAKQAHKNSAKTKNAAQKKTRLKTHLKTLSRNRKALKNFHVEETLEVGIALLGSEVKPVRQGEMNLSGSYAIINLNGEIMLKDAHIKEYTQSSYMGHEYKRHRRLLAKKKQIEKLALRVKKGGFTLVPLEVYEKNRWIKVKLALARGKRKYDQREDIKKRDAQRDIERALKNKNR